MSITLLRWKAGAGGDTLLKLLLESDPELLSQNRYLSQQGGKTMFDVDYVDSFRYQSIAKMSRVQPAEVDQTKLFQELEQLYQENPAQRWLLKTHCYFDFLYPIIDIVIDRIMLPFAIQANLTKNSRQKNLMPDYHPMIPKIKDPDILYKFDCYNSAVDLLQVRYADQQIQLLDLLSGWDQLDLAVSSLGLHLSKDCCGYYLGWLQNNQQFMPSCTFISLVQNANYDYHNTALTTVERYCLLAMAGEKFCLL